MNIKPRSSDKQMTRWAKQAVQAVSSYAKQYESQFSEFAQTFSHLGVLLIAFIIVIILFMWKDGMFGPSNKSYVAQKNLTKNVNEIPTADVGVRMLLDQAQGEMGISSREALLDEKEAFPGALTQSIQKLDLKGPWTCVSNSSKGKAEIYVKNKQIRSTFAADSRSQNTLIAGDCMYEWSDTKGVKQCGVGQYMDMIDSFIESGMFDLETILKGQLNETPENAEAYSVLESCKPLSPSDTTFAIPQGVIWSEKEVNAPDEKTLMDFFGGL